MRTFTIILLMLFTGNFTHATDLPDGRVNSDGVPLRLRAGPGLDYAVLDLLDDNTPLAINARNADSTWLEIRTLDQFRMGWVYAAYVEILVDIQTIPDQTAPLGFRSLISGISERARSIYENGQEMGNRPGVFAKVGDSITVSRHMLYPIGEGVYNLDTFDYLQETIDFFSSETVREGNAFTNTSAAAGVGWNAAAVLMPQFTDPTRCLSESPLVCEYRTLRPAFALIMFGTNDVGYVPASTYRHNLERIVAQSIEMGVVPVLSTIPPRTGYEEAVITFNQIIRDVAGQYDIPIWDYGYAMSVYGQTSLGFDGVHPSLPPMGHEDVTNFAPDNLYYGYVIRNLSALHVLDSLRREIVLAENP